MEISKQGVPYTLDRKEAYKYRVLNAQANFLPDGAYKYVHLFTKFKKFYLLPVCLGQQYKINKKDILIKCEEVILRDWQERFLKKIETHFNINKHKSLFIESETATGKSYAMLAAITHFKQTAVIVAPKKGIVVGLYNKMNNYFNCKTMTSSEINKAKELPEVLITTGQSFNKAFEKINKFYNVLLIDEAHKMSEKRIGQVNMRIGTAVIGFSGTPSRSNFGEDGFKMLFGEIRKSGAKSLKEKIVLYRYNYKYSEKEFRQASRGLPDLHPEIYRRLYMYNKDRTKKLVEIVDALKKKGYKRMIVFTDRDKHVEIIKEALHDYNTIILNGKTKRIKKTIDLINDSEEYVIIGNISTSGEGVDIPRLQVGILFVSVSSVTSLIQMIGRQKRIDGEKKEALFIDFIDVIQYKTSKKKSMGFYSRNREYKKRGFNVIKYNDFLFSN